MYAVHRELARIYVLNLHVLCSPLEVYISLCGNDDVMGRGGQMRALYLLGSFLGVQMLYFVYVKQLLVY